MRYNEWGEPVSEAELRWQALQEEERRFRMRSLPQPEPQPQPELKPQAKPEPQPELKPQAKPEPKANPYWASRDLPTPENAQASAALAALFCESELEDWQAGACPAELKALGPTKRAREEREREKRQQEQRRKDAEYYDEYCRKADAADRERAAERARRESQGYDEQEQQRLRAVERARKDADAEAARQSRRRLQERADEERAWRRRRDHPWGEM